MERLLIGQLRPCMDRACQVIRRRHLARLTSCPAIRFAPLRAQLSQGRSRPINPALRLPHPEVLRVRPLRYLAKSPSHSRANPKPTEQIRRSPIASRLSWSSRIPSHPGSLADPALHSQTSIQMESSIGRASRTRVRQAPLEVSAARVRNPLFARTRTAFRRWDIRAPAPIIRRFDGFKACCNTTRSIVLGT